MIGIRMRLGMWLYFLSMRTMPPWAWRAHFGLIALGAAKISELQEKGEDVDAVVEGLLEKWQEESKL